MSKNILIVTGSDYSDAVYQAFYDVKKLGHKVYLLSDGSFEPKPEVFEKHFRYDLRKTKETLEYMKNQKEKFDAVTIKTSEWLTPLVALLGKQYGCIGNEPIVAFNCRSKYHMRQILEKGGVPIPKFKLCKNYEELINGIREIKTPCVAKPVGGNASYGTFMIRNDEDIKNLKENYENSIKFLKEKAIDGDVFAFNKEEMDLIGVNDHVNMITDYLVEEYMDGHEISIDSFVQDGKITMMGVEDQIRMTYPYFMQLAARLPYIYKEGEKEVIQKLLEDTMKAMNIKNSATHTEIMFTSKGPKIVEIGCRIGGDDLHETILEVTGYNLMYESIMIALGIHREYDVKNNCHAMLKYIMPEKNGTIKSIQIPEELKNNKNIFNIDTIMTIGDKVGTPPERFDYIGYISGKGKTPQEAEENVNKAIAKIKIIIE
ncbi:MAG: ATP-grasp domain-containing protein [Candidatus Peregrinibacteria bacterium]|nr:ATP-grasp domain-containing protein [Candidatus Peregrinibacteria bacterium]